MTLEQISGLGKELFKFLKKFDECFCGTKGRSLLLVYVTGQLSSVHRKTAEAIALALGECPRTLQRFLESIVWKEGKLRDTCQMIVAREHTHPDAIGCLDESSVPKSGDKTTGAGRQWCGHIGKIDNCVVGVHLSYSAPGFQCLLDSALYLPADYANDSARRVANHVPPEITFLTKQQIGIQLIDRAVANGIRVKAWTFDEFYGRDNQFLDELENRQQAFVAEVPANFHGWIREPEADLHLRNKGGRLDARLRTRRDTPSITVEAHSQYSDEFNSQSWQQYRIKDTEKGPVVWEVKWSIFYRKSEDGLPSRRQCLIVARNSLTGEVKYFVSNRIPGEHEFTLRCLLRIAFGRWVVESCFRQSKEELGMDHYEVRGWGCIHRHYFVTQLSHLLCARIRQKYDDGGEEQRLTIEQVRSAVNQWLVTCDLSPSVRKKWYEKEAKKQEYYQRRNYSARKSHTKTTRARYLAAGIDVDQIKSCIT